MDRDEALKLLNGGTDGIAEWNRRRQANEEISELAVDLRSADLSHANLVGADLRRTNLNHAVFRHASLIHADLSHADLSHAVLRHANLTAANLSDANLTGATLIASNLNATSLGNANFRELYCAMTVFANVDLSAVKGLDSVKHGGPSTLGIDSILRSEGKIPKAFLRGCGVPNALTEYLPSLIGSIEPIQFCSCFISYSSVNRDFAERLHADFQAKAIRCWFDQDDLKIGEKFRHHIDQAIRIHDKLLVVLTEDSIASDWVEAEVEAALERERNEKRTVIFPIRLDDALEKTTVAWASHIRRTRHVCDFSGWKDHDSYQTAFIRLLKDLRASVEPA